MPLGLELSAVLDPVHHPTTSRVDRSPDCPDPARELVADRLRDARVSLQRDAVADEGHRRYPARRAPGSLTASASMETVPTTSARPSADEDLRPREVAPEAVGVADRDDPDPCLLDRHEPPTVAGRGAGREAAAPGRPPTPSEAPARDPIAARPRPTGRCRTARSRSALRRAATPAARAPRRCWRRGARTGPRTARSPARKRSSCRRANTGSVSDVARCVISPTTTASRLGQLREAPAAHPGVELQVDVHAFGDAPVGHDELEPRLARPRDLLARGGTEHDDPHVAVQASQRERLAHRRDAERGRPALERAPRGVGRTVAVAVGLDDRPELGRSDDACEQASVATDRADVDRDERAGHGHILAVASCPAGHAIQDRGQRGGDVGGDEARLVRHGSGGEAVRDGRCGRGVDRRRGPSRGTRRRCRSARRPSRRWRARAARCRRRPSDRRARARSCRRPSAGRPRRSARPRAQRPRAGARRPTRAPRRAAAPARRRAE